MNNVKDGYKMTEVGEIPESWEVAKLGEISEITMGQLPIGSSYNSNGEGIALLNGPTEFTSKYPIPKQWTIKPTKLCSNKDILFCVRGSSTGRMNISNDKYCIGRGLASIRGKEKHSLTDFIYQIMIFNINSILSFCEGSTFPNISRDNLNNLIITIPPLKEQEKISLILSSVDKKIENTDNLIEKTKELKKGLIQRLLTKGIGHERFKDTELGRIPVEWEVKKLGSYVKLIHGYQFRKEDIVTEGLPIIKIGQISKNGTLDLSNLTYIQEERFPKFQEFKINNEDVLMALSGATTGKVAFVKNINRNMVQNYRVGKMVTVEEENNNMFLYYQLKSKGFYNQLMKLCNTSAQPNFGKQDMDKINMCLPLIKEQKQIALILTCVDEKIVLYESKKAKLQELKNGLMHNLLTGKSRVQ